MVDFYFYLGFQQVTCFSHMCYFQFSFFALLNSMQAWQSNWFLLIAFYLSLSFEALKSSFVIIGFQSHPHISHNFLSCLGSAFLVSIFMTSHLSTGLQHSEMKNFFGPFCSKHCSFAIGLHFIFIFQRFFW